MEQALLLSTSGSIFLQPRQKRILATALFAILWIAAVAVGLRVLFQYENRPGRIGAIPRTWPTTEVERAADRPTLVMFVHPHCPCSEASLGELAKIMARLQGRIEAYVLFVKPNATGRDWVDTDLLHDARAIPGVKVVVDAGGKEAGRFGVETSGHTFLFGVDGRLLFSGGITASRGHAGANVGESSILALFNQQAPIRSETLVFGCPLAHSTQTGAKICMK